MGITLNQLLARNEAHKRRVEAEAAVKAAREAEEAKKEEKPAEKEKPAKKPSKRKYLVVDEEAPKEEIPEGE